VPFSMISGGGITVRYIYSASIVTSSKDLRILHDPWFTEGIYDGAWFHYPTVKDPIRSIAMSISFMFPTSILTITIRHF